MLHENTLVERTGVNPDVDILHREDIMPNPYSIEKVIELLEKPQNLPDIALSSSETITRAIQMGKPSAPIKDDIAESYLINAVFALYGVTILDNSPENMNHIRKVSSYYLANMLSLFLLLSNNQDFGTERTISLFNNSILSLKSPFSQHLLSFINKERDQSTGKSMKRKLTGAITGLQSDITALIISVCELPVQEVIIPSGQFNRIHEIDFIIALSSGACLPIQALTAQNGERTRFSDIRKLSSLPSATQYFPFPHYVNKQTFIWLSQQYHLEKQLLSKPLPAWTGRGKISGAARKRRTSNRYAQQRELYTAYKAVTPPTSP